MVGPVILAFLILLTRKSNFKNIFISGILFSAATLFKIPALFDVPVVVVFWLVNSEFKKDKLLDVIKKTFYLLLGFATPIILTFIWYLSKGALKEYVVAAFLQNIGYLSSFRPRDIQKPFLSRNLPLIIRSLVVLGGIIILYIKRASLSKQFVFLTIWLLFTLFAVALSERPYPHYLIQSVPAISLLLAMLFSYKTIEQALVIIPLSLAFFVPVYYKFYYYPSGIYYERFFNFATGRISKEEYFAKFDQNLPRYYKISEFITSSTKKDEKIFVWKDSPQIYALSRRIPPIKYVAGYHIDDFAGRENVARDLEVKKPKFIIMLPNSSFSEIGPLLKQSYVLINTIEGAEIWSYMNFSPKR